MSLLNRLNKTLANSSVAEEIKDFLSRNIYISDVKVEGETLILTGERYISQHIVYFNTKNDDVKIFNSKYIKQVKVNGSIVFYIDDNDFVFNPDVTFIADEIIIKSNDRRIRKIKNLNCKCRNFKVEHQFIRVADSHIECEKSFVKNNRNILSSTIKKYVK